jgi:hypothetical protein
MTPRRLFVCLSLAVLTFTGCPCWVPAPRHSPRRMYSEGPSQFQTPPVAEASAATSR